MEIEDETTDGTSIEDMYHAGNVIKQGDNLLLVVNVYGKYNVVDLSNGFGISQTGSDSVYDLVNDMCHYNPKWVKAKLIVSD